MPAISIIKRRLHRYTFTLLLLAISVGGVMGGSDVLINNAHAESVYIPTREELAAGQVEIIAGDNKTVFEYRVNGRLLMIKIVPKLGATYYMVPADGQPHFDSLDHKKKLYPQWRIIEF